MKRRQKDTSQTYHKGFDTDEKSRSFMKLYLQVLENVFAFYSNSLQSVFRWIYIPGGDDCHYFCSAKAPIEVEIAIGPGAV